jgi:SAM-dependent methyltransferase
MIPRINVYLKTIGINFKLIFNSFRGFPVYIKNYFLFRKSINKSKREFDFGILYPQLSDRYDKSGVATGHYFHQDLFVAQRVYLNNPQKHVDIGSRVDGFVAHLASFREVEVFDIRKLENKVHNIIFRQVDFSLGGLDLIDYCDSVSSLHAIEHFGLGRYGDRIDYYGYLKGLDNIYKLLKPNGKFYFSTPIGKQRIEFDAHRVFSMNYLLELFKEKYVVDYFSYVDDKGDMHPNQTLVPEQVNNNFNCMYGCGIFEMTKLELK